MCPTKLHHCEVTGDEDESAASLQFMVRYHHGGFPNLGYPFGGPYNKD